MLGRQVQRSHFPVGIHVKLEIEERRPRLRQPQADVDKAPARRLGIETDVFSDAHLRDDADLLRDKDHPRLLRCGRVGGTIVVPAELDPPRVAAYGVEAGHDLDERRFSRAILPEKGGDLAGVDGNGHIVERSHARKGLGQVTGDHGPF